MAETELILSEFRKQDEVIAEIREKYTGLTVAKDGFKAVKAARIELKNLRCGVENLRKELKADVLERGKAIDAEAKRLTALLVPVEEALEAEEKAEENRKAEEARRKAEEAELALQIRVNEVAATGVAIDTALLKRLTDSDYQQYLADCRLAAEMARKAEEEAEAKRRAEEEAALAERDRLEALRQEEIARQAAELAIREAELAEERRKAAEKAAADAAVVEAERAELRRQQELLLKQQAELRAKAEAEAAEQRRKEKEAEQARREAAAAPELEKLEAVRKATVEQAKQALSDVGLPMWSEWLMNEIQESFDRARDQIRRSL